MKTVSVLFICCVAALPLAADPPIVVVRDFPARQVAAPLAAGRRLVHYHPQYFHFMEDAGRLRGDGFRPLRAFFGTPGAAFFSIAGGRLERRFLSLSGALPEQEGLYWMELVPAPAGPTAQGAAGYLLQPMRVEQAFPVAERPGGLIERVRRTLLAQTNRLAAVNLAPLYRGDPAGTVALRLRPGNFTGGNPRYGLSAIELLGGGDGRWVLRFPLAIADSARARRENEMLRMYCAYLESDDRGRVFSIYYTIVDWSVYTR